MNELTGKGMYLWIIDPDEKPGEIASACFAAGLSHVAIKVADAGYPYNVQYDDQGVIQKDLVHPLVNELKAVGIQAWGWAFVYGYAPDAEASIAINRVNQLGLDGFIVNAEGDYKGKNASTVRYMDQIRNAFGGQIPIALSSYRYPSYHPTFPWQEFLSRVDINMPQVYWILSHNPGAQLERSLAEFRLSDYPQRPVFPTGAAFSDQSWRASAGEVQEFMETAKQLGLKGCNFWLYSHAKKRFPDLWKAISEFDWDVDNGGGSPEPEPEPSGEDVLFYAECTAFVRARIRVAPPDGGIIGYLDRGVTEPVYGVSGSWYRIGGGYVGASLMKKVDPPVVIEDPEDPIEIEPTIEERVDRVEGDLNKVMDYILQKDPEAFDAP